MQDRHNMQHPLYSAFMFYKWGYRCSIGRIQLWCYDNLMSIHSSSCSSVPCYLNQLHTSNFYREKIHNILKGPENVYKFSMMVCICWFNSPTTITCFPCNMQHDIFCSKHRQIYLARLGPRFVPQESHSATEIFRFAEFEFTMFNWVFNSWDANDTGRGTAGKNVEGFCHDLVLGRVVAVRQREMENSTINKEENVQKQQNTRTKIGIEDQSERYLCPASSAWGFIVQRMNVRSFSCYFHGGEPIFRAFCGLRQWKNKGAWGLCCKHTMEVADNRERVMHWWRDDGYTKKGMRGQEGSGLGEKRESHLERDNQKNGCSGSLKDDSAVIQLRPGIVFTCFGSECMWGHMVVRNSSKCCLVKERTSMTRYQTQVKGNPITCLNVYLKSLTGAAPLTKTEGGQ